MSIPLDIPEPHTPMDTHEVTILALCAVCGWLALGYTLAQTALLLLASGAVLSALWLAYVLCLA